MKLSRFDRFTAFFAPVWTKHRVQARAALDFSVRHYEAAAQGFRTTSWSRSAADADNLIRAALVEMRMHARDLIRNNSYARRGQRAVANNTVGWGIVPKAQGANAASAKELWKRWAESTECESEGRMTFYGLQSLVMRSIVESGEVLIRRRYRRPDDALTIPLQLQVLEADYLDTAKNFLTSDAGGPIIGGVEFDKLGKRAAYWLYPQHPGSGRNYSASQRYDAADILHIFYSERPGQTRGISWLATSIVNLKDLDAYEDAELMKQKIAACFAVFVEDPTGETGTLNMSGTADPLIDSLEPGAVNYMAPGKKVSFASPPTVTGTEFTTRNLRKFAAGLGVTYEDVTGDYSNVNFSSGRLGRLAANANVVEWQWNMLIPLLCAPAWQWAMEAAQLAGELPTGDLPSATWTTPPVMMTDPDKEITAKIKAVRGGLMTLSAALREQGEDPESVFEERAKDDAALDAAGLVVDSDPRKMTAQGMEQASTVPDPEPEEKTPPDPKAKTKPKQKV